MTLTLNTTIALLSVAVPLLAFVWEFAVVRRKKLGYRVQMDSRASGTTQTPDAEVLRRIGANGDKALTDPSFVLIRIENAGWMEIDEGDYLAPGDDSPGLWVKFKGRRVVGMALTDYSDDALVHFFTTSAGERPGFGKEEEQEGKAGVLRLPKVKLNNGDYYKVMVVLERTTGEVGDPFEPPVFEGDLLAWRFRRPARDRARPARRHRWSPWKRARRTESHTFASGAALVLIGLLATAVLAQSGLTLFGRQDPPPLDCVGGTLHLHGSTAFEPSVRRAAETYQRLCAAKGARIDATDFQGSGAGITTLEAAGNDAGELGTTGVGNHLTFHDGEPAGPHPQLLARPVAYSLYTLVINPDARVRTLTLSQIRDIYAGRITNWSDVKGADLPVNLVNRSSTSGTLQALVERVLNDPGSATRIGVPPPSTPDCAALGRDKPGSCEADSTQALLETVAEVPGALGMSEVSNAATAKQVVQVRIGQVPATPAGVEDGRYPYWQTEIAYTFGELPSDSIAAGFLRYLTDQGGKDILREFGNRPCSETEYPLVCEPT